MNARFVADHAQVERFVRLAFKHASPDGWVSLRVFGNAKKSKAKAIVAMQLNGTAALAAKAAEMATKYANEGLGPQGFVFAPVTCCTLSNAGKASETDIKEGLSLGVEIDERPNESLGRLVMVLGDSTIVVFSGGTWHNPETGEDERKAHVYWRLTVPTRDKPGHARLKEARRKAMLLVKADPTGTPLNHPMRWPGGWHTKNPDRVQLATIGAVTEHEIDLYDAIAKLDAALASASTSGDEPHGSKYTEETARADIIAGRHYQGPTLHLIGLWCRQGVPIDKVIADLQALFDRAEQRRNDWREARDDIKRQAKGIFVKPKPLVLSPNSPLVSAREFAERPGAKRLLHHASSFYEWQGTHYAALGDHDIEARLYSFMEAAGRWYVEGSGKNKVRSLGPFHPMKKDIENLRHALQGLVHISDAVTPPAWLKGNKGLVIACQNGLLRLEDETLLDHTPNYFNTSAADFDYDPEATDTPAFDAFQGSIWPNDAEAQNTLLEVFGYVISGDTRHQKMFQLIGPKRSGKGTIGRVLRRLVGSGGTVGPMLAYLSKEFGLEPLINKSLAIFPDARIGRGSHEAVEKLLAVSGCDSITIGRKYKTAWTGVLPTRIVLLTNVVPTFADNSGAIASRFITLQLLNSFLGEEDLTLGDRLEKEMPGILNLAIAGWKRLKKRGHFIQPASGKASADILDKTASPIRAFVEECCEVGQGFEIKTKDLYGEWSAWCVINGRDRPGTENNFGKDLKAAYPSIQTEQRQTNNERARWYVGIRKLPK